MSRVHVDADIRPLSEFRAGVATFVKQIHETRRPMVLTQRGRGVAVLVDVQEYERMQERLEVLEEVYKAEEQIGCGAGISHQDAKSRVLNRLTR
jgi:prevent-host-death family protein